MKFSLLERLKKGGEKPKAEEATPDLARLNLKPAETKLQAPSVFPDMQKWLERDLDGLRATWNAFVDNPARANWQALSSAVHNFHGASGAYGGGALTRLTENLQRVVTDHMCAAENKALINLHVQACQAWAVGNEEARTTLADAVCEALERQVRKAI
ncbi:MAG: hypothetical protein AAGJ85_04160 [Pseudomonadota bacterium]